MLPAAMQRIVLCIVLVATPAVAIASDGHHPRLNFLANTNATKDEEARGAFVKKCIIAVSVRDKGNLPVDAVQQFCQETNAIVECRQKFVPRLTEAHKTGPYALKSFCVAIYGWFQAKYGMFCPDQCDKLQCKNTCAWLKRDGELHKRDEELKASLGAAEASYRELEELSVRLEEMSDEVRRLNRTLDQAIVEVQRAAVHLAGVGQAQMEEQNNYEKAKNTTKKTEDALAAVEADLEQKQESIVQLKREIDIAEIEYERRTREIESLSARIDAKSGKVTELQKDVSKGESDKAVLEAALAKEQEKVRDANADVTQQRAVVAEKKANLQDAEDALAASKAANDAEATIQNYESLVEKQTERYKKEQVHLETMEHDLKIMQTTVNQTLQEIQQFDSDVQATMDKLAHMDSEVSNLTTNRDALQEAANSFQENNVTELKSAEEQLTQAIADTEKDKEKASKSVDFAKLAQTEQEKMLANAVNAMVDASAKAHDAAQARARAESAAIAKQQELDNGLAEESRLTQAYQTEHGELLRRFDALKEEMDAHTLGSPEIVKQHGLGMLQDLIK